MTKSDSQDRPDSGLLPGEKPTLKTIARISGLAVPTVSRALNDAPDIKDQTKALVRRIAREVGYVPNRAGVRLRTGRTNVISLVLAAESEVMNHNAKLIAAVAGELRGTPFHLNITPFFRRDDVMQPIRYVVETRSADAVIFNQTTPDDPRIAYLMERGFPFATHGRSKWADQHQQDHGESGEGPHRATLPSGRAISSMGRMRVAISMADSIARACPPSSSRQVAVARSYSPM